MRFLKKKRISFTVLLGCCVTSLFAANTCTVTAVNVAGENQAQGIYANGKAQQQLTLTTSGDCSSAKFVAYYAYQHNQLSDIGSVAVDGVSSGALSVSSVSDGFVSGGYGQTSTRQRQLQLKHNLKGSASNNKTVYVSSAPKGSNAYVGVTLCVQGGANCATLQSLLNKITHTNQGNFYNDIISPPNGDDFAAGWQISLSESLPTFNDASLILSPAGNAVSSGNVAQSFAIQGYTYAGEAHEFLNNDATTLKVEVSSGGGHGGLVLDSDVLVDHGVVVTSGNQPIVMRLGTAKLRSGQYAHATSGSGSPQTPFYQVSANMNEGSTIQQFKSFTTVFGTVSYAQYSDHLAAIANTPYTFSIPAGQQIKTIYRPSSDAPYVVVFSSGSTTVGSTLVPSSSGAGYTALFNGEAVLHSYDQSGNLAMALYSPELLPDGIDAFEPRGGSGLLSSNAKIVSVASSAASSVELAFYNGGNNSLCITKQGFLPGTYNYQCHYNNMQTVVLDYTSGAVTAGILSPAKRATCTAPKLCAPSGAGYAPSRALSDLALIQ